MTPYYERDGIQIFHADCRDVLPTLERVDHCITDPPFDRKVHARGGHVRRYDGGPQIAAIPFAPLEDVGGLACQIALVVRRWALIFCAVRQIEDWAKGLEQSGWNVPRVMVWVKPDASPQFSGDRPGHGFETIILGHPVGRTSWNGHGMKGVFTHNRMDFESGPLHPTQKPLLLMRELVELFTDPGDLILDPFCGSGTTLVAAYGLGRRAIGVEIEEKYAEVAAKRLEGCTPPLPLVVAPRSEQGAMPL